MYFDEYVCILMSESRATFPQVSLSYTVSESWANFTIYPIDNDNAG